MKITSVCYSHVTLYESLIIIHRGESNKKYTPGDMSLRRISRVLNRLVQSGKLGVDIELSVFPTLYFYKSLIKP